MKSDATGSVKSQSLPDISIKLSVGSLCSQCHRPLYEEEIMSGWSTEPSCMMTECPWCRLVSSEPCHFSANQQISVLVPNLTQFQVKNKKLREHVPTYQLK